MWNIFTGGKTLQKPPKRPHHAQQHASYHASFLYHNTPLPAVFPFLCPSFRKSLVTSRFELTNTAHPSLTSHSILQSQHFFRCSTPTSHSSVLALKLRSLRILFCAVLSQIAPKMTNPLKISCNPTSFVLELVQNMLFIRILVKTRSQTLLKTYARCGVQLSCMTEFAIGNTLATSFIAQLPFQRPHNFTGDFLHFSQFQRPAQRNRCVFND